MNVEDICRRNPITVKPEDSLGTAAGLMGEHEVGFLVVVQAGRKPVGVLTGRDLAVAALRQGASPDALLVRDVMTPHPIIARVNDSLERTLPKMRKAAVRRVPVVGFRGELVGLLSCDDIFDTIADNLRHIVTAVRSEESVELAARTY